MHMYMMYIYSGIVYYIYEDYFWTKQSKIFLILLWPGDYHYIKYVSDAAVTSR